MKASTLEKINTRLQKELGQAKRRARKAELALARVKDQFAEMHEKSCKLATERDEYDHISFQRFQENAELRKELNEARQGWNKLGNLLHSLLSNWAARKRQRLVNWALVKRMNKPRVEAVTEAGYVPAKLIKMAHAYWEHDQKRLQNDDEIVWQTSTDYTHYNRKPGLFRRLKIILGRT